MDWTGGVRRRFAAGKNNAVLQKQKAHFAKVRGTLQHTPSSHHTFQPDFVRAVGRKQRTPDGSRDEERVGRDMSHHRQRAGTDASASRSRSQMGSRQHDHPVSANREKRRRSHSSPSVISISSGSTTSSSSSAETHHGKRSPPPRPIPSTKSRGISATDEERLLQANRRRILARGDWLGMAAPRPMHIRFSSLQDKDRIGKRRKLERSNPRMKVTRPRLVTPLFEDRLVQPQAFMSGALPVDDIRIKIGTDALASQTQRSRHSATPANVSVRHPSTEFGPLSEESMLLGEYEATDAGENVFTQQHGAVQAPSMVAIAGSRVLEEERFDSFSVKPHHDTAYQRHEIRDWSPDFTIIDEGVDECNAESAPSESRHPPQHTMFEHEDGHRTVSYDGTRLPKLSRRVDDRQVIKAEEDAISDIHSSGNEDRDVEDDGDDDNDDEFWREILKIRQHTSSHASMAALRSSSQHKTTSGSSHHPLVYADYNAEDDAFPEYSTPRGAGTQGAFVTRAVADDTNLSAAIQSPSASLKQIVRLAEQPLRDSMYNNAAEDADDNDLWRDFVVGSQGSESNSSQHHGMALTRTTGVVEEDIEDAHHASMSLSACGTSHAATLGNTLFVTGSTPGSTKQFPGKRKRKQRSESLLEPDVTQTSMRAHADEEGEHDSIEDIVPMQATRAQPSNIHASSATFLNPNMFKRKRTAPPREPSRFVSTRRANVPRGLHSVYDLVDSDGISII